MKSFFALLFGCYVFSSGYIPETCEDFNSCGGFPDSGGDSGSFEPHPIPDSDGDGFSLSDCDDDNPYIHPDATEVCNGLDDDCDGIEDDGLSHDADEDGYYAAGSCLYSREDCKDDDPNVHPRAEEICNSIDDNCNGVVDEGCP